MSYGIQSTDFDKWLKQLDKQFQKEFTVSYRDCPDFDWYELWEEGYSIEEAIEWYKEEYPEFGI